MQNRLIGASLTLLFLLVATAPAADRSTSAAKLWEKLDSDKLKLRSKAALIVDQFGNTLYQRASDQAMPIASITKLMTAMVILDAKLPMQEVIEITKQDRDLIRLTGSRLRYGARLTREELLTLALMSSENRAAAALGRTFPGGTEGILAAMNQKARDLGMRQSRFADPAGLKADNVASANDLAKLVQAAMQYPQIKGATTRGNYRCGPGRNSDPCATSIPIACCATCRVAHTSQQDRLHQRSRALPGHACRPCG